VPGVAVDRHFLHLGFDALQGELGAKLR
jgi:hypothetical protein